MNPRGTKIEIPINVENISFKHVYKVKIIDQTGRAWPVVWPSRKKILTITHYKELDKLTKESTLQKVRLHGYEFQNKFVLAIFWNPEVGKKISMIGRNFEFNSHKKYTEKLGVLKSKKIPIFLKTGEADFED